jgi:type I restriction enzyme S subunit
MADKAITIPKGWKMTTLGGVAEKIAMGPFGSNIKIETFVDEGVPVISGTHLNGHKLEDKDYNFITSEHADKLKSSIVFADDIIFTHAGNIGQVAYIPKNSKYKKYILSQRQFFLRPKKDQLQTEYLTYFFKTREGQHKLLANANQTGVPSIAQPASYLKSIEINLPPLPEQCAIAAVLSSLDDKIELLREQNKTLEATAQAIFKEWFVNFNFPGATGKMIDSELGEIPEGWRVGKIKDLIDILSGFAFSSSDFSQDGNYKLVTIKNVQDRHFDPETKDRLSALPVRMPEYCKLNSGDILLSLTGNVGRICLVNGDNFLLNQRVAKLKEKNPSDYAFTYLLFLQDSIFSLLQSTASGTAQQNLSPIQTKEIEIIIADRKTLDQFGMVANKLIQKINDNNSQVETLSKLRDTLLPKLMTGNVRVKGFED